MYELIQQNKEPFLKTVLVSFLIGMKDSPKLNSITLLSMARTRKIAPTCCHGFATTFFESMSGNYQEIFKDFCLAFFFIFESNVKLVYKMRSCCEGKERILLLC